MAHNTLPFLPGNSFNDKIGQTKFHRSQLFEYCRGMPMITDKQKAGIGGIPLHGIKNRDKYPSVYAKGEVTFLPAWLTFDKQVLCFVAYFQETAQEREGYALQVRRCKIYFYLEDGTVQVIEPKIQNSGIPQGTLIARSRIPFPAPRHYEFYDILDFNIGCTVELHGRIFKITDCDHFTRMFLNRLGIFVPDPVDMPPDPYQQIRAMAVCGMAARKPNRYVDTRGQFLEHDRHVLRFCGYWDNRDQPSGMMHHLAVHYFLADDTIEIRELIPPNSGRDEKSMFLNRCKLPKYKLDLPGLGHDSPFTVLNVMSTGFLSGRYIADPLNCGLEKTEHYKEKDLSIGACINCYGRKIVLTDCDPYTREYYRQKYGIEDFSCVPKPYEPPECMPYDLPPLPPYNGWGTYEDSAGNCKKMIPEPPKVDFVRFFEKDRLGLDSNILRFQARMKSNIPENCDRTFIVSFYLADDTISVFERTCPNTGFQGGMFFARAKMYKPGQDMFVSKEPEWYKVQDMYIGNTVSLNDYLFELVDADEYALRYFELHSDEFPLSNFNQTICKLRMGLQPVYKDVFGKYLELDETGVISYCDLRKILKGILGENLLEQDLVTIARKYNATAGKCQMDKETLRSIVHTELKRFLFYDLDRLLEGFLDMDRARTGFVERKRAYALCRAARVPIDKAALNAVLAAMPQNDKCETSYPDLIQFFDYKKYPCFHTIPINQKITFGIIDLSPSAPAGFVDLKMLLNDLNLEGVNSTQPLEKPCA